MRDRIIRLSMASFVALQEVYIHKKANEHGMAVIRGVIAESSEGELFKNAESGNASLYILDEKGKRKDIFSGIIDSMEVKNAGGVKTARIVLSGSTKLMDCVKHTRTFQNQGMTYDELLEEINAGYEKVSCIPNCKVENPIKKLIVQYKETDWEFLKRMASRFYQPLLPDYAGEGIRYSFGLSAKVPEKKLDVYSFSTGNAREEFLMKEGQIPEIIADDFTFYKVKSREYLELGERTVFSHHAFFVYEAVSVLEGEELLHTYILRREGGFQTPSRHNRGLIGASLDAAVLAVDKDTVKIVVAVDKKQEESKAKWFPYSTVYSSPDGSGWYCMPERGDKVRLYFPSEYEDEGYVISAINLGNTGDSEAGKGQPRSDPARKAISNMHGKQVTFTPGAVILTNNKGMTVALDDEKGVMIASNKNVTVSAEDSIVLKSDMRMDIQATKSIKLARGDSSITFEDELKLKGTSLQVKE